MMILLCKSSPTSNAVPADENSPISCPPSRCNVTHKEGEKCVLKGRCKTVSKLVIKLRRDPYAKSILVCNSCCIVFKCRINDHALTLSSFSIFMVRKCAK